MDPASIILNQMSSINHEDQSHKEMKANDLTVFDTRTVPGDFNIWREQKLYVFG